MILALIGLVFLAGRLAFANGEILCDLGGVTINSGCVRNCNERCADGSTVQYCVPSNCAPAPAADYEVILNHKSVANGLFSSVLRTTGLENENNPDANTYSIIGTFDAAKRASYQNNAGEYQFKLEYYFLDGSSETLVWAQTSWITEPTITGFRLISAVGRDGNDYNILADGIEGRFQGLGFAGRWETYLDGNGQSHSNFFEAVGEVGAWGGGIPALFKSYYDAVYRNGYLAANGQTLSIYAPCVEKYLTDLDADRIGSKADWGGYSEDVWLSQSTLEMPDGVSYSKFLVIHPSNGDGYETYGEWQIDGAYTSFSGRFGQALQNINPSWCASGFGWTIKIYGDGTLLNTSPLVTARTADQMYDFTVDLTGVQVLKIVTSSNGAHYCDWATILNPTLIACPGRGLTKALQPEQQAWDMHGDVESAVRGTLMDWSVSPGVVLAGLVLFLLVNVALCVCHCRGGRSEGYSLVKFADSETEQDQEDPLRI